MPRLWSALDERSEAGQFGFVVGAFSWELLPIVFRAVRRRASERLERP
ncbi:hypothetical protein EIB18_12130 [Caulobacter vibrioides]|uniref:Uncharacterized protein n=2 Tax=Caulobacter vibrioides TaxID=155892 RepID=Q9A606_CAUVC|nr:hypothetical protein [Caulobacter vibrioides]YP_002517745.1 hypothetical protein CCNA_02372 [Caulobacter vibrioides NA1000]AAK24260.1 hypothetical protein CC_2289 [Caulobacter vibrioides CB15]ACL95837.1 hypothetical protein CCNA_02372 [Caulobacter vibrioides NA1000]ATC29151.1 hypothetical protein CA607_12430 [Caulobacter vibrioides]AZH13384.1 hypothetical protein EIB18_12130 [Caulobacter vibrioides]QXZ50662.1 hypothetical protein KZH45_12190 [Caulobacter vibrioides]